MVAWRYEISLLMLKKYFTRSLRSLVKYFSTLEEKFRISARPCNILYISYHISYHIISNHIFYCIFVLNCRYYFGDEDVKNDYEFQNYLNELSVDGESGHGGIGQVIK